MNLSLNPCRWLTICCLAFGLLVNQSHGQKEHEKLIQEVETGLSHTNRIRGEPTWTIQERMEHYGVPGLSLAVIQNNQVVWTKAYGVKDLTSNEPVTKDTLFQCASISKPLSAAASLRLVEQGAIDLDADANLALKTWQIPESPFTREKCVTLKHLISHKSGLTVHGFLGYTTKQKVPSLTEVLNGSPPANSASIRVDKIPGESFRYSGGGYCVLQQMMLDQTEDSFPQIMNKLVLARLGMKKSTYEQPLPADRLHEAAVGYLPSGKRVPGLRHTYPEMAAAGLWSTSEELAQFLIELQKGYQDGQSRVLSNAMAKRMLDERLGIFTRAMGNETYFGHGGWNEGFSSEMRAHRDRGYGVVVLTNGNHPPLIEEVINSVARAYQWENAAAEYAPLEITPKHLARVVGRYNRNSELVKVAANENKLFMHQAGSPPVELFRVAEDRYVRRDAPEQICFAETNEAGETGFRLKMPGAQELGELTAIRLSEDEKLPIEWIESGDFEKASSAYLAAQKLDPEQVSIQEDWLNNMGYARLNGDERERAIDIFRVNTLLYPKSFNTWDSLGEAYRANGELEKSIANYQKSLDLNPANTTASKVIKEMREALKKKRDNK